MWVWIFWEIRRCGCGISRFGGGDVDLGNLGELKDVDFWTR